MISYTVFMKKGEKVRKKLVVGVKRTRETLERVGPKTRVKLPEEEDGFIGRTEDGMVVGTNGQVHSGLGE